jgi:geranylgeranyl diphosphate synthase type II
MQIHSAPAPDERVFDLTGYLADARRGALKQLRGFVAGKSERYRPILYDLMLEYSLRQGKGLRPALCIAACRSLGGSLDPIWPTAAVFELYHNAFLIHDDVEDASELRRGSPTLHRTHGVSVAMNTGDAMLALALRPLLGNLELLGLGKTLAIFEVIARMAEESAEGQAMELDWIRRRCWDLCEDDYVEMVSKKTSWYSFIAPMLAGAIAADASPATLRRFEDFGRALGVAFQVQDDLLNLVPQGDAYGKEREGDLWEGKHTLILIHALRAAKEPERAAALESLARSRARKSPEEVRSLAALIRTTSALETVRGACNRFLAKAAAAFAGLERELVPSVHRRFFAELVRYVVERDR